MSEDKCGCGKPGCVIVTVTDMQGNVAETATLCEDHLPHIPRTDVRPALYCCGHKSE